MSQPLEHDFDPAIKLIAAVIYNPGDYDSVNWVMQDMFHNPNHGVVWETLSGVMEGGSRDDVVIQLMEGLHGASQIVMDVMNTAVSKVGPLPAGTAAFYADRVAGDAHRRCLLLAAHKAITLIEHGELSTIDDVMRQHWQDALDGERPVRVAVPGLYSVKEFVDIDGASAYDWVVPGFLEHQERVILVAPVKAGKSVLTRQLCMCVASGRHPFDPRVEIPPKRVLLLDLENPAGVLRRDLKRQIVGTGEVENMWVLHQPAGIDLGSAKDRRMVEQAIIDVRPDLVCIGPLYKAYDALDESWEKQAAGVQKPIDYWRSRYGCAFWIEHHASKSDPTGLFGSSRWARWFDAKVALVPEDPAVPPPYQLLEWQATYRDSRRVKPELLEMTNVNVLGDVSWRARFTADEPFGLQMERACED
jgi:replicative DNA helicase